MKTAVSFLLPFLIACGDAPEPGLAETDSGGKPRGGHHPDEGVWVIGGGDWTSDECEAQFLSTPTTWTLSSVTETDFFQAVGFSEPGSQPAEGACTLAEDAFECDTIVQEFGVGMNASIHLEGTSTGSFSSSAEGTLVVTFDIECEGSGCGGTLSLNPCTSVVEYPVTLGD